MHNCNLYVQLLEAVCDNPSNVPDRYGYTHNVLDSVWNYHIGGIWHGGHNKWDISSTLLDLEPCVALSHLALENDCEPSAIERWNQSQNPLFSLQEHYLFEGKSNTDSLILALLEAGYDIELRDDTGATPLLVAAYKIGSQSFTCLQTFVSCGACVHVTDDKGCGAIHLVLDFEANLRRYYDILEPALHSQVLERPGRPVIPDTNPSDCGCHDKDRIPMANYMSNESADLEAHDEEVTPSVGEISDDQNICDFDCGGNATSNGDCDTHFHYNYEDDIDDFEIDEEPPEWMQKARVRLKLQVLLNAGCDPNLLDGYGMSPDDYARSEELWPQWRWALDQCGYVRDTDSQQWLKRLSHDESTNGRL